MKKLLVLLTTILLFTGCNKLKSYEEINYEELNKMIENKEDFILFIGSSTCSHCAAYKEKVNKFVKEYQTKIYYIDIHKFSETESNKFKLIVNFEGTPTTVFFEKGKEKEDENGNVRTYRIEGNIEYSKVVEKIKKAGFIKD